MLILLLGLFLGFSRAAWGLAIASGGIFYLVLTINEQQACVRLKYVALSLVGLVAVVLMLALAMQLETVSYLVGERFKIVQDYDGSRLGRFARLLIGFSLALEKPWGIGPLRFSDYFVEDTHNILLKSLMAYGWIGFISWVTITIWTLAAGFKLLFRQRPWLPYFQVVYIVFFCHVLIGNVVDTDHWRHYYLLMGIVWGCIALEARWRRQLAAG